MNRLIPASVLALAAATAFADVRVSAIFSDNMVLQRGKPLPVWGTAAPGEKVTVAYGGKSATATAGANGRFEAVLPALAVEKTGKELVVSGRNRVVFGNVLVGDVWLVSGQSNSEMSFGWGILNGDAEREKAKDYPNIRAVKFRHETAMFPSSGEPCCGKWVVADKATLANISAEGYFMARELNAKTGIPMGILDDNWSGCRIEPFVNLEGLAMVPALKKDFDLLAQQRGDVIAWAERLVAAKKSGDYGSVGSFRTPGGWTAQYNQMIAPIVKFPIAGATWYQGCSNGQEGDTYVSKLEALVGGWRQAWGYDFPFYIVQLASYRKQTENPGGGDGYANIRNAQRIAAEKIPHCGLAVAIDIGNAGDIHPKNKYDVGYRLSLWARRDVYGEKALEVSGPLYKSMSVEDGRIRVKFSHVGKGLVAAEKGPDTPGVAPKPVDALEGKLTGFAIAGADKRWYWATAEIDGRDLLVSAEEVANPVAVRYAFRGNPMGKCNLYNRDGLPASPFRTDDWNDFKFE